MEEKFLVYFIFLFISFFLILPLAQAPDLCSWRGYANKSGTLVNTTDVITVTGAARPFNATVFTNGYYTLDIEATSGATLTFKINGVSIVEGTQAFTCPATTLNILNISMTLLSNTASCSFSRACSGGYCCSGATEYTGGEGTGTCQASVCTATTTSTPVSDTGGGGGGAAEVTVVEESKSFTSVSAGVTAIVTIAKSADLKIKEIDIKMKNDVSNIKVTVKEGSKPAAAPQPVAATVGKAYKYIEITKTNLQDADIEKATLHFDVEKSWMTANSIDADTVALQRYKDAVWNKLTTTKVTENKTHASYSAESPGLSVFVITGEKVGAVTTTTTTTPVTTTTTTETTTTTVPPIIIPPEIVPGIPTWVVVIIIAVIIIVVVLLKFKPALIKR